eukprot:685347-Prymnesium_polylepis.1
MRIDGTTGGVSDRIIKGFVTSGRRLGGSSFTAAGGVSRRVRAPQPGAATANAPGPRAGPGCPVPNVQL